MSHSIPTNRRLIPARSIRWVALASAIAIVVVMADALSKWLITRELGPGASRGDIRIAGDFIELHFAQNAGVAFGLLSGSSTIAGVLVGIVIVPLGVVLFILAGRGPLWAVAAGLVLGGAAGNLLDRIGDQMVTDFVSIGRFPSFNEADSAITVGALCLIGLSFRDSSDARMEDSK